MKNIAFLGIFLVFSASAASYAVDNNYLISSDGSVQSAPSSARPASPEENRAINEAMANPGMEVPFGLQQEKIKRVDFFHGVVVEKRSMIAICNNDGKVKIIEQNIVVTGQERRLLRHVIWIPLSIVSIIVFLVLSRLSKDKVGNIRIIANLFVIVAINGALAVVNTGTIATAAVTIEVIVAGTLAIIAATVAGVLYIIEDEDFKYRKSFALSIILYFLFAITALVA